VPCADCNNCPCNCPPWDGIIPSTTADTSVINLLTETITINGMTVLAFSIDGGKKWKKGALPTDAKKVGKLFNKPLELWVSDQKGDNGKPITKAADIDESKVIKFPAIEARSKRAIAKPGKLAVWYAFDPDTKASSWFLADAKSAEKTPLFNTYEITTAAKGLGVYTMFTQASADMAQKTYFVRTPANKDGGTHTPASKAAKVKTAKPTKDIALKEKNGAVQLKKGWTYRIIKDGTPEETIPLTAKADITFDTYNSIEVWATPGKKPASKVAVNTKGTWKEEPSSP